MLVKLLSISVQFVFETCFLEMGVWLNPGMITGPEVIKLFSCSTQLSTKFQLLINLKYQQIKKFLALCISDVVFIMQIMLKCQQLLAF